LLPSSTATDEGPSKEGSSLRQGHGVLRFSRTGPSTSVSHAFANSPLRLLLPKNHGHAAWAYLSSLGGGLVEGDEIDLHVVVDQRASAFVSSQGPTRVYRSVNGSSHCLRGTVKRDGCLVVVPDPISLFEGARCLQTVSFSLDAGASLVWLDVLGAGRVARGERWAFSSFTSELEIRREGDLWIQERMILDRSQGSIAKRMGRFEAFATLVLAGPRVEEHIERLSATSQTSALPRGDAQVSSVSRLATDGCVVRLAAIEMSHLNEALKQLLGFLPDLLGDDPFARRP
jgi:urease accessory protein